MARWQGESSGSDVPEIAEQPNGGEIEVWGDGEQTRSFLYVEECLEQFVG